LAEARGRLQPWVDDLRQSGSFSVPSQSFNAELAFRSKRSGGGSDFRGHALCIGDEAIHKRVAITLFVALVQYDCPQGTARLRRLSPFGTSHHRSIPNALAVSDNALVLGPHRIKLQFRFLHWLPFVVAILCAAPISRLATPRSFEA